MSALTNTTSASADLFGLSAELLSFPGPEFETAARTGELQRAVGHIASHLPYAFAAPAGLCAPEIGDHELEHEFIRLFDVPDGPPTPLYTGVYAQRRRDAMEELLRFYRHFGLTLRDSAHDLPDFVPTLLEFVGFLSRLSQGDTPNGEGGAAMAAKADLLERHLIPWARETASRLGRRNAHPFYIAVVALVRQHADAELAWQRSAAE